MTEYGAPWSKALVVATAVVCVVCVGVGVSLVATLPGGLRYLALLALAAPVAGALFTIRGYTLTRDTLGIRRLLWTTRLPLAGLRAARSEPDVMQGSLRTFGNGGLFAFAGLFRNRTLGSYRAFVTDPRRTVVLEYPGRPVVVSPDRPEAFVRELPVGGANR